MTASEKFKYIIENNGLVLESVSEYADSGRLELMFGSDSPVRGPVRDLLEMELPAVFPFASGIDVVFETKHTKPDIPKQTAAERNPAEPEFPEPDFSEDVPDRTQKAEYSAPPQQPPPDDLPEDPGLPSFEGFDSMPEPEADLYDAPVPDIPEQTMSVHEDTGGNTDVPASEPDDSAEAASSSRNVTGSPAGGVEVPEWQKNRMREMMGRIEKQTLEYQANPPGKETPEFEHRPGSVLCGRTIKTAVIPMRELDMLSETQVNDVVVCGEILRAETVDISDKTLLFKFDITDKTNSISCKKFVQKSKDDLAERMQQAIVPGAWFTLKGKLVYDSYERQKMMDVLDMVCAKGTVRSDDAPEKRVELHMHTQYSAMDAVSRASEIMKRAKDFGHDSVGITDHGVLQAFPEVQILAKKYGIKALYGVEGYLVDGGKPVVTFGTLGTDQDFDGEFVFFDLETTGLSCRTDGIIEIAAVRIREGRIVDSFRRLIDPHRHLPPVITKLTGLTDAMLQGQAEEEDAIAEFYEFAGDAVLAAHNAPFDIGFLKDRMRKKQGSDVRFPNTVVDTLPLAQILIPDISKYNLGRLCSYFKIKNEHAHRALEDAAASAKVLLRLFDLAAEKGVTKLSELESIRDEELLAKKQRRPWHVVIYAKNQDGLRDLYEMVSIAHLQYFHTKPRIPRSLLKKFRKNLIIGSACVAGELFQAVVEGEDDEEIEKIASFYDYLEVQPLGNNMFMTRDQRNPKTVADLQRYNEEIIDLGHRLGKPVCATGDVHFVDREDAQFRAVLTSNMTDEDADLQPPLYYRNTQEMLDEFKYLPDKTAREIVIDNPRKIAAMFDEVKPVPDETYPPVIEGAEDDIRNTCEKRAHELYGENLPSIVRDRMDKELNSIIGNGYAVLYLIAQKLVENSEKDGYLVGSRGSVGSSFVAMLCGITEVNSLPPHYVCPECSYSEFFDGSSIVGPDLPDKVCPDCGAKMRKDGYDIPFETFLGFEGDKEPDIDLNFSGDNQAAAHAYTEVLFGKGKTFRAGTISTLAEKTAYGYVKHYFDSKGIYPTNAEVERLKNGCTGVKRTTGQHPGGIMVVPKDQEIYRFTPVQHPADDTSSDTITTHFDYHSISGRLLKLDILGHDDPTMLRILYNNTGVDPRSIPLDDKEVISLFTSTDALKFTEDCPLTLGTAGVPEFGTPFVKGMVTDTKPASLADLIRISGLSHGTDVWNNNAQDLVRNGTAGLDEVICTRDDIMLGLIDMGLPPKTSFGIMEKVRKGKGLTPEAESLMREKKVPNWYIDSCKKIGYMFPKAHAAAYVIMAFRIAWYKINYPAAYYAAYFGIRAKEFDLKVISAGLDSVRDEIARLEAKSKGEKLTGKEDLSMISLELALEMYCRGYSCSPIDMTRSESRFFIPEGKTIIPPFTAVSGLGMSVAENIVSEREKKMFISQDDLQERTHLNNTCLEQLRELGCLDSLPRSDQISFFNF